MALPVLNSAETLQPHGGRETLREGLYMAPAKGIGARSV